MRTKNRIRGFWLAGITLMVLSCSPLGIGVSQQPKYYMLSSLYARDSTIAPLAKLNSVGIGVGPVRFPRHLDRKEIVTRTSENEIMIDDFALWAGPLSENFNSVLAENLSVLLATNQVVIFPWRSQYPIKYQVIVHVTRFDGQLGKEAWLRARWAVLDEGSKKILYQDQSIIRQAAASASMEAMVAAKSSTIVELSREIARVIAGLEK